MLITVLLHITPEGYQELHNGVGSSSPTQPNLLVGFKPGTFQLCVICTIPLCQLHMWKIRRIRKVKYEEKNLVLDYSARTYQWVMQMPLINLSIYWILWSMFLVIHYTGIMHYPIIQFLSEIRIFWPITTDFLLKYFTLHPFWKTGCMPRHYQVSWLPNK